MKLKLLPLKLFAFSLLIIIPVVRIIHAVRIELEDDLPEKCDFRKCPTIVEISDPTKLYVHLVPHTHDDVGWLKTVDQYYYGTKQWIQNAGVQYILDTVIDELIRNKQRKFIYVETAYFWKWWLEQDEKMRSIVRELVRTGQFEFINGGWSMPDEATTHYQSLIDQSTWGLRRLNDTFGKCGRPRVTWQIDPFGHSREMASLYAQMGYDAMYFAREDYQDRRYRQYHHTLEHVWQGSDDLGNRSDIFTGMMQMGYGPPNGLDWDLVGGENDPIVDNKNSEEYNVPEIVEKFQKLARKYSYYYATNHIMFPMGTDFNYQSAHQWYKNMDKLIDAINGDQKSNVRTFYSTPTCYTKALWNSNHTWTSKNDDYFPYASDPHAYWTGYYTSRPSLKRMERVANNWLQACKQLDALAINNGRFDDNITNLREAMGILQHHDAVSGTEKQHVANDYARLLHKAIVECQQVISQSFGNIAKNLGLEFHSQPEQLQYCNELNISSCPITESGHSFTVTLYNPLSHPLSDHRIRLPVNEKFFYQVFDAEGHTIPAILIPIPEWIRDIPGRSHRYDSNVEIVFKVNVTALGIETYTIRSSLIATEKTARLIQGKRIDSNNIKLSGNNFDLYFDQNGQPIQIAVGQSFPFSFQNRFRYYEGAVGDNKLQINRSSGAYIFRPNAQRTYPYGHVVEAILYVDNNYGIVQEVHQRFDSNVGQIIRLTKDSKFVEFDYVIEPISILDNIGKEIVVQYQIKNYGNNGQFYTDANGRQLIYRKWNYRRTWPFEIEEPIAGNYYPVNSRIILGDHGRSMAVLTDRSQGGTSPSDGTIELMVHRRLLHDDGFGVDEALNETGIDGHGLVIRGRHRLLLFYDGHSDSDYHRPLSQQFYMEPIMAFSKLNKRQQQHHHHHYRQSISLNNYSLLETELPPQIHLLTLEQWSYGNLLIRLENIYQHNEYNSKKVTVNLRKLFTTFNIIDAEEMTLAANQPINALDDRLRFNYQSSFNNNKNDHNVGKPFDSNTMDVEIGPMEIRTFLIRISKNMSPQF
ncbi:lysosomal alpha-mannosidase-like protein 2 [Dermatophagoides farinae]|uniref:Alpha-mannosidase n=1 Tax=Dermatophagoides farinae TaxID=6954 RepID=A0A9D4P631_DERFA|nr:lysosomal alpha-mannosidase-like [Dermatophagoides farinae]KAH7644224.1 lysosomal alpha-mannosidase-like protein 2 [Dermatophagoides farinae]